MRKRAYTHGEIVYALNSCNKQLTILGPIKGDNDVQASEVIKEGIDWVGKTNELVAIPVERGNGRWTALILRPKDINQVEALYADPRGYKLNNTTEVVSVYKVLCRNNIAIIDLTQQQISINANFG